MDTRFTSVIEQKMIVYLKWIPNEVRKRTGAVGLMVGFSIVVLVCRNRNRYWIVDWSNHNRVRCVLSFCERRNRNRMPLRRGHKNNSSRKIIYLYAHKHTSIFHIIFKNFEFCAYIWSSGKYILNVKPLYIYIWLKI